MSEPGALEVHGLTSKFLRENGISCKEAANKWRDLIWKYKPILLLGYNCINFDIPIIMRLCKKYPKNHAFPWPPVMAIADVMFLAQWQFQKKGWPTLKETVDRLGIPSDPERFHDAEYDVAMTWKCFVKLTEKWR
jgi:DNA polymerase III epsilon subunit-like protein